MKFSIPERQNLNQKLYSEDAYKIALQFSKKVYKEFGSFLRAAVLFGASARKERGKKGDIDILIIVDDVRRPLNPELVEAYRIILEKLVIQTNEKIHVTTLKFTTFWDHVRKADPIAVNILRDGIALIDTGFFDPMQALMYMGKIRPSPESINIYQARAERSLQNSGYSIMKAVLDLYWGVIDSAHACLMKYGHIPPSPAHVVEMLDKELYQKHLLAKKHIETMKEFYSLMKMITHRDIKSISGRQYESYYEEAESFVNEMKLLIARKQNLNQ